LSELKESRVTPEIEAPPLLSTRQVRNFRNIVYTHCKEHRRELPWRHTHDPYGILVSEIMLQQTQVARVVGKYEEFMRRFPDIETLASAPLRDVLAVWQGLGYNRRALALKKLAEAVVKELDGTIPRDMRSLARLPGIGKATAHAIQAFAYNQPVVFVETNIRTVFIHHFLTERNDIKDTELIPLVALTVDTENPRRWYNALMDYGAWLKKQYANPGRISAHYRKQAPFEGSDRQVRGVILKTLMIKTYTEEELTAVLPFDPDLVRKNMTQLAREGLIKMNKSRVSIA
jgi:A/G-specific adenine glycosylase